jgi:Glycosyl transferase family group 2
VTTGAQEYVPQTEVGTVLVQRGLITEAQREWALGVHHPFNVTEGADLGIRAAALGLTVGVVNSTTFEEANRATGNFIRQRSRWIQGYLQTVLVHTRGPIAFAKATGPRQVAGFLLLVAVTPVTFLLAPPLWAIFIASLVYPSPVYSLFFPGWVLWLSLFNLIAGNGLMIYVCMMGAFKRRRYELVLWALLNPVYWVLHSIAAYKALWQLITRPHYVRRFPVAVRRRRAGIPGHRARRVPHVHHPGAAGHRGPAGPPLSARADSGRRHPACRGDRLAAGGAGVHRVGARGHLTPVT